MSHLRVDTNEQRPPDAINLNGCDGIGHWEVEYVRKRELKDVLENAGYEEEWVIPTGDRRSGKRGGMWMRIGDGCTFPSLDVLPPEYRKQAIRIFVSKDVESWAGKSLEKEDRE